MRFNGLQADHICCTFSFLIAKERLESDLISHRSERLPQVVALCTNRKELARIVTVQAGKQSVQIFAVNLLQHSGERFLQPLLQAPEVHGRATVSLDERSVPALFKTFQLLEYEATPDRISVPDYLKFMLTLSSCNAWSALEALTASLVPEKNVRGGPWEKAHAIPVQALNSILEIMTLFLPLLKISPNNNIGFADEALPIAS